MKQFTAIEKLDTSIMYVKEHQQDRSFTGILMGIFALLNELEVWRAFPREVL